MLELHAAGLLDSYSQMALLYANVLTLPHLETVIHVKSVTMFVWTLPECAMELCAAKTLPLLALLNIIANAIIVLLIIVATIQLN